MSTKIWRWRCGEPGCKRIAQGVGSPDALSALGWDVGPGAELRCPAHHPDGVGQAVKQAERLGPVLRLRSLVDDASSLLSEAEGLFGGLDEVKVSIQTAAVSDHARRAAAGLRNWVNRASSWLAGEDE